MQITHTFFEHQHLLAADFCHHSDFRWLITQVEKHHLNCFVLTIYKGEMALKAKHYLLLLVLPSGNFLEILPKTDTQLSDNHLKSEVDIIEKNQSHLWVKQMLCDIYAIDNHTLSKSLPLLSKADIDNRTFSEKEIGATSWMEEFVQLWFDRIIKLAPIKNYQNQNNNKPNAYGKLLIKEQIRYNSHRPHYFFTTQTKYIQNPLWSRFFYTVLIKLKQLGFTVPVMVNESIVAMNTQASIQPLAFGEWQQVYKILSSILKNSHHINKQVYNQNKLTLQLGYLILEWQNHSSFFNAIDHNSLVPATIIDMNLAFERWVTIKLTEQFPYTKNQTKHRWLTEELSKECGTQKQQAVNKIIKPDVLILNEEQQIKTVVDIKYKQLIGINEVSTSDLYQIYTYLNYFNADEAWLIYPKTEKFQKCYKFTSKKNIGVSGCYKKICISIIPFDCLSGEIILK